MDPVTHAIVGRSLDYLRPQAPREPGRGLAAVLGALSLDIDAVFMPIGWDRYLAIHEIGTHTLIGVVACAVLTAPIVSLVRRGSRPRTLLTAAVIGAASHLVLDLLSGATVRIGWPFTDTRIGNLGAFAMGDPFIVGASAAAAIGLWRFPASRRRATAILIIVVVGACAAKFALRSRAMTAYRQQVTSHASDGVRLVEPVWGSPLTWQLLDRTSESVRLWTVDARGPDATIELTIPRLPTDEFAATVVEQSREWDTVRHFTRAHDFTFATVDRQPDGRTVVWWSDIRYCTTRTICGVRAGGEIGPAGDVRLQVAVGSWLQER